ncbi:MAG: TolC family protein [Candidatus Malihini olakiniferum]
MPTNTGINILGHRLDISAARWWIEAAKKRIHVAKTAYYPDISITGFIGYQSFGLNNLTRSGNDIGSIGPALYLPIFTGRYLLRVINVRRGQLRRVSVATYNNMLTLALHDIANVVTRANALKARLSKTENAFENVKAAYLIADKRYRGGLATYLDVLITEDTMLEHPACVAEVATSITGIVQVVNVVDTQWVKQGDVLVQLDDTNARLGLALHRQR